MNILYLFFLSVTKKHLMLKPVHSNHNPSKLGCKVPLPSLPSCLLPWSISKKNKKNSYKDINIEVPIRSKAYVKF